MLFQNIKKVHWVTFFVNKPTGMSNIYKSMEQILPPDILQQLAASCGERSLLPTFIGRNAEMW